MIKKRLLFRGCYIDTFKPDKTRPLDERPLGKRLLDERPLDEKPLDERPVKERTWREANKKRLIDNMFPLWPLFRGRTCLKAFFRNQTCPSS